MTQTQHDTVFTRASSEGYQVNHMARLFARALQSQIKPLGLSTGTFPVLLALWDKDGRTQRELVEDLWVEQATMANTLARMERDGLISRRAHDSDARVQTVWLTERARGLRAEATTRAQAVNDTATRDLTPQERASLAGLMAKVIASMQSKGGS